MVAGPEDQQHAEIISPWARRVNAYALTTPEVEPIVMTLRRQTAQHVERYFAAELNELSPAHRADLAATIDVLTSVEAGRSMSDLHDRSTTQTRRAWTTAVTMLLDNRH